MATSALLRYGVRLGLVLGAGCSGVGFTTASDGDASALRPDSPQGESYGSMGSDGSDAAQALQRADADASRPERPEGAGDASDAGMDVPLVLSDGGDSGAGLLPDVYEAAAVAMEAGGGSGDSGAGADVGAVVTCVVLPPPMPGQTVYCGGSAPYPCGMTECCSAPKQGCP